MLKHKHLIVSAEIGLPLTEHSTLLMQDKLAELVDILGMEIMHGPVVMHSSEEGNAGLTGFCVITTSHIAFHHWSECNPQKIEIDTYSCKDFNPHDVIKWMKFLCPSRITYKFLDRENNFETLEKGTLNG